MVLLCNLNFITQRSEDASNENVIAAPSKQQIPGLHICMTDLLPGTKGFSYRPCSFIPLLSVYQAQRINPH